MGYRIMSEVIEFPIHRVRPSADPNMEWLDKVLSQPITKVEADRIIDHLLDEFDGDPAA